MDRCRNCNALVDSENEFLDWEAVCAECGNLTWLTAGDIVSCTVKTLTQFGIFVELGDRVKGIIHISELSNRQIAHASEVVSDGDTINTKVLRVDVADRKIGLSLRRVDVS